MKNPEIIVKRVDEIFFTNSSDVEISFPYNYFNKFIKKYNLSEIFEEELYLDKSEKRFSFNLSKISEININENIINSQNLQLLSLIEGETYLNDNLIFLGNNEKQTQAFIFFPYYKTNKNDDYISNDFLLIKNEGNIDLEEYISTHPIYKRNGVLLCLEL
ncbi:MAG: hypothetical protein AB7E37_03995 [Candidatus Altimarinota bacterium]